MKYKVDGYSIELSAFKINFTGVPDIDVKSKDWVSYCKNSGLHPLGSKVRRAFDCIQLYVSRKKRLYGCN